MKKGFDKVEKDLLKTFTKKLLQRLDNAKKEYGDSYMGLSHKRTMNEIEEEILDISGWAMMFWLRLKKDKIL